MRSLHKAQHIKRIFWEWILVSGDGVLVEKSSELHGELVETLWPEPKRKRTVSIQDYQSSGNHLNNLCSSGARNTAGCKQSCHHSNLPSTYLSSWRKVLLGCKTVSFHYPAHWKGDAVDGQVELTTGCGATFTWPTPPHGSNTTST